MSLVRLLILIFGYYCTVASAAVTCEQLAGFAIKTQQLRDQGYSLTTVLAEVDKLGSTNNFTATELYVIKDVVDQAFKSSFSPQEILQACRDKQRR